MGHLTNLASNELGEGVTPFGPWITWLIKAPCRQGNPSNHLRKQAELRRGDHRFRGLCLQRQSFIITRMIAD